MGMMRLGVVGIVCVLFSCKDDSAEKAKAQTEIAQANANAAVAIAQASAAASAANAMVAQQQEVKKKHDDEKRQLAYQPGSLIEATGTAKVDSFLGLGAKLELTSVTLTNKSHFGVSDPSGVIRWFNKGGTEIGTQPFSIRGSLAAGATQTYAPPALILPSSKITGNAGRVLPVVNGVNIID